VKLHLCPTKKTLETQRNGGSGGVGSFQGQKSFQKFNLSDEYKAAQSF
jgi:hypothetical protein